MRLTIALLLQLAALGAFLIWGFAALFAPMLFAGENNINTRIVFWLFLVMPASMIPASIAIWVGFAKKNNAIMITSGAFVALSYLLMLFS